MACGLSLRDSLLPQLLPFTEFEHREMCCLSSLVQGNVRAASRQLLEACVLHSGRLWPCPGAAPQPVSRCTLLISSGLGTKNQQVLKFQMIVEHVTTYALTIPDASKMTGL